jgi:hypothetical protein
LPERLSLLGHPVQSIERHHDIEVFAEWQPAGVGEAKPRTGFRRCARGVRGRDHSLRRVRTDRIPARHHARHRPL